MTPLHLQLAVLRRLRRDLARRSAAAHASPEERKARRTERLTALVSHAAAHSPYYARLLAGREHAPLGELPVTTKEDLLDHFDEVLTVRRLDRGSLEAFARSGRAGRLHGYWVAMTSGSTGQPAVFAYDIDEWTAHIARSAQGSALSGSMAGPPVRRVRSARIGSALPAHTSRRVPETLHDPRRPTLALDAIQPMERIAERLQDWQPHVISAFPSVLAPLAEMQSAGALAIAPRKVFSTAEALTDPVRRQVHEAWGLEPFNRYVSTEGGVMAAECDRHGGLHVLDHDLVLEVVDDSHRPVPPGVEGSKVLLTVLSSRTVPLIRYELSDRVTMAAAPCTCGRRSPLIAAVGGRRREVLSLPGRRGVVSVHPSLFNRVLDTADVAQWQVVAGPQRLLVQVVRPGRPDEPERVAGRIAERLGELGVDADRLEVVVVDEIARQPDGKRPLVTTVAADGADRSGGQ